MSAADFPASIDPGPLPQADGVVESSAVVEACTVIENCAIEVSLGYSTVTVAIPETAGSAWEAAVIVTGSAPGTTIGAYSAPPGVG